jgi:UDP-N-acetylglucosamine--N-acetylmuramyl-(pentapeptide) pyrophosphoryl-undecaprenol N-acetylglucosamine transferase
VDDHQTLNAKFSVAGWRCDPAAAGTRMTPESISDFATTPRSRLQEMAERARELAKPEATAELARMCEELAN